MVNKKFSGCRFKSGSPDFYFPLNWELKVSSLVLTAAAALASPEAALRSFSAIAVRMNPSRSSSHSTVSP